jgi:hypothetical protein
LSDGVYEGRLVADGNGNLLADEGDRAGQPVAYDKDNDNFRFLKPGEPSHNDQHHENFVGVVVTQDQDPDQPGYAGSPDDPAEGHEHHFGVTEDDPHYEEDATDADGRVTHTRLRTLPDSVSRMTGGHTSQHRNGGVE